MDRRVSIFALVTAVAVCAGPSVGAIAEEAQKFAPAAVMPLATPVPSTTPTAGPPVVGTPGPSRRARLRLIDPKASVECKVKSPAFEGRAALRNVRRAILQDRPVRVIALGSSASINGSVSPSPRASYPVRLENDLEGVIEGLKVEMFARGQSGEVAEGATERIMAEVAEVRPDLVVWQVGTNDAVARIDADTFGQVLRDTLTWLASHNIDVVLIDPQYVERLSSDARYTSIVNEIANVASEKRVLLVNRYDTMADLSRQYPGSSYLANDRFHLNDLGYRCMAEYATKAIVAGILQADTENGAMH